MSDNPNKHNGNNSDNGSSKNNNQGDTRSYSEKIGENKAQQDRIQKGGEITPKPNPPKNNDKK